jgi:hypothetical protein
MMFGRVDVPEFLGVVMGSSSDLVVGIRRYLVDCG